MLPDADPPRDPRRAARERRGRLPHSALAPELPALERGHRSARTATSTRASSYGGRRTLVAARPISVDPTEFDELAAERAACVDAERELDADRPEFLVLRVDRTDPSKNIVRGFRAFELYLDAHPEMHGRVGDARAARSRRARTSPSTRSTSARSSARRGRVNDRFQRDGWVPIDLAASRTTSPSRSPPTSSTTCCS